MGKETQYDKTGKLKNRAITPKYSGERELGDILEDNNWRKLGACEISCISVTDNGKPDERAAIEVNERIKSLINPSTPKTELQLLKEQNALLAEQNKQILQKLEQVKPDELKPVTSLTDEYKEIFGKMPHHKMTDETIKLKIDEFYSSVESELDKIK